MRASKLRKLIVKPTAEAHQNGPWTQLEAIWGEIKTKRPAGSFTAMEYAKQFNVGHSTARRRLAAMLKAGKIEKIGNSAFTYYVVKS